MLAIRTANIEFPKNHVAPDEFQVPQNVCLLPDPFFVISRFSFGLPLSFYGDHEWDLTPYQKRGRTFIIHFDFWKDGIESCLRTDLIDEARWLLFMIIWMRDSDAAPLSLNTIRNYRSTISDLARFAERGRVSMLESFSDEKWLVSACRTIPINNAQLLPTLLSLLNRLGPERVGYDVVDEEIIGALRSLLQVREGKQKQHPPIPTRIYEHLLAQLSLELDDWESIESEMLRLVALCTDDRCIGRDRTVQRERAKQEGIADIVKPTFSELAPASVVDYLERHGHLLSIKGLSAALKEVQCVAKTTLQAYTGMRDEEATDVPLDCLETEKTKDNNTYYFVSGVTTKLSHGLTKRVRWVTNEEGARAIKIAQKIARIVYKSCNTIVTADDKRGSYQHPLFVSTQHLALAGANRPEPGHFLPMRGGLYTCPTLVSRLTCVIEEDDLRELELIDVHRSWRSEKKFQIGAKWAFTSHQLRRSLALYAQRSGLVSITSLRRQLKHLTETMTRYYAKGSSFAASFLEKDKRHFAHDWREGGHDSALLKLIYDFEVSNERHAGGLATFLKRHQSIDGKVFFDREVTKKRLQRGEIAYRGTALGGCGATGQCDKPALDTLGVTCVDTNCKNLDLQESKLVNAIKLYRNIASALDKDTVEYRDMNADLKILERARAKHFPPEEP